MNRIATVELVGKRTIRSKKLKRFIDLINRAIGAVTIAVAHRLDDTPGVKGNNKVRIRRAKRVGDIVLFDHPADDSGPRTINCYVYPVECFDVVPGKEFKVELKRLLYSLQRLRKAIPPDFDLQLVRDPAICSFRTGERVAFAQRRTIHAISSTALSTQQAEAE